MQAAKAKADLDSNHGKRATIKSVERNRRNIGVYAVQGGGKPRDKVDNAWAEAEARPGEERKIQFGRGRFDPGWHVLRVSSGPTDYIGEDAVR